MNLNARKMSQDELSILKITFLDFLEHPREKSSKIGLSKNTATPPS